MRNLDIQIERLSVERLILSDANPRTRPAEQVAQIAASIREFGFVNPILVAADGGIIAGEARPRSRACVKFPERSVKGNSKSRARGFGAADNARAAAVNNISFFMLSPEDQNNIFAAIWICRLG